MADIEKLDLKKDPLTNIALMTPLLNDESRKAVSYIMYGYYMREAIAEGEQEGKDKKAQAV